VDRAKTSGDSVTPVDGGRGELVFRACDFGPSGATGVTVEAAGEGTVHLSVDSGPAFTLSTRTAGRYEYVTVSASGTVPDGVHDVRVTLDGPVRLARLAFQG